MASPNLGTLLGKEHAHHKEHRVFVITNSRFVRHGEDATNVYKHYGGFVYISKVELYSYTSNYSELFPGIKCIHN